MDLLEELVAERDVRTLLARYTQLSDDAAYGERAALFSEGGVLETGETRVEGRGALQQWLGDVQRNRSMRHLMMNVAVTIDSPSTAHSVADLLLLRGREGRWAVASTFRYADRFVKEDGAWLIAHRQIDLRVPAAPS